MSGDQLAKSGPALPVRQDGEPPILDLLRTAIEKGADVEALERLVGLYERWLGQVIPTRYALFGTVGALGVVVHMAVLAALHGAAGEAFALAQTVAVVAAMSFTAATATFAGSVTLSNATAVVISASNADLQISGPNASLQATDVGGSLDLFGDNIHIGTGGDAVGFFGVGAVSKPTVSGSRGGNAALASLMIALSNLGLVTDSTS